MSATTLAEAFAPAEAAYRAQVREETFGHLAPKKNKTYPGRVVWALGCFGSDRLNPSPLFSEFKGLDSSPWFYDALIEFLHSHSEEEGFVFEFIGTFRNYEFRGTIRQIMDANKSEATK